MATSFSKLFYLKVKHTKSFRALKKERGKDMKKKYIRGRKG
jgi:hypothetical protein